MLKLESPNLHEIGLDRVIAYGHTWSPLHELMPETPLRHGHAISIDMAYSATLAHQEGLLSEADHKRLLTLFSRAGLSIDHPLFDETVLDKGTAAILKTRDGKLRLAVPNPLGSCTFLNDLSAEQLNAALAKHKAVCKTFAREGAGIEAYVDSSDTGYANNETEDQSVEAAAKEAGVLSEAQTVENGINGSTTASKGTMRNGAANIPSAIKSGLDAVANGLGLEQKPLVAGVKSGQ
jgi:3-dehydroquinate synthase